MQVNKGSEENIIIPTVKMMKKGLNLCSTLISDIVDYKYIGIYHGCTFKTLFRFNAINITLGLKYLITRHTLIKK